MEKDPRWDQINARETMYIRRWIEYGLNWLARDKTGQLYAFQNKPERKSFMWIEEGSPYDKHKNIPITLLNEVKFSFMKWEDEPMNINFEEWFDNNG